METRKILIQRFPPCNFLSYWRMQLGHSWIFSGQIRGATARYFEISSRKNKPHLIPPFSFWWRKQIKKWVTVTFLYRFWRVGYTQPTSGHTWAYSYGGPGMFNCFFGAELSAELLGSVKNLGLSERVSPCLLMVKTGSNSLLSFEYLTESIASSSWSCFSSRATSLWVSEPWLVYNNCG